MANTEIVISKRNMMKKLKSSISIIFLMFLVSCTKIPGQINTPLVQPSRTEKSNIELTPTNYIQSPEIAGTAHLTTLPTTTPSMGPEDFNITTYFPEYSVGVNDELNLPGTLVFAANNELINNGVWEPKLDKNSMLTFWNPRTDTLSFYGLEWDQGHYIYTEAPDKEKLALTIAKPLSMLSDLILVNYQGDALERITYAEDWTFFNWLNNEELLFRQYKTDKNITRDAYDLISINMMDQKQLVLSSDFPEINLKQIFWSWGVPTIFNPEGTSVVYQVYETEENRTYSILWDTLEEKTMARIAGGDWVKWASDGSKLLLVSDVEKATDSKVRDINLIDTNGVISRVSYFSEYYDFLIITLPVWSPDNRFIAFWAVTESPVKTANLAILDTQTLSVDLISYEINPYPKRYSDEITLLYQDIQVNSAIPIWSPDNRYLLIEDYKNFESSTLLIDLQNHTITKIAENARPVGWLK